MRKFRRGLGLFILYGQTSLAAYLLYTVFSDGVQAVAKHLTVGVPHWSATLQPFATSLAAVALITWLLYLWRKTKCRP